MLNYYKYLLTSSDDKKCSIQVLNTGFNKIRKDSAYPLLEHPTPHYFTWNQGRKLNEYQVIYITKGEGVFESENSGHHLIKQGTIIFLFPGEWHRFKPNLQKGWDEFWVGFNGDIIENIVDKNFISKENAIFEIGLHKSIIQLFKSIIEKVKGERTSCQFFLSGILINLLGNIQSIKRLQSFEEEDIVVSIINKAKIILKINLDKDCTMERIAEELNVSYAWFRKSFKVHTGIAPNQYLLKLKIDKAKILLVDHSKTIKEIAYDLNFESPFYFSKLFKNKIGISPELYRKNIACKLFFEV
jgi:AraC-like DNA-binding protein